MARVLLSRGFMHTIWLDLVYGIRGLRRSPMFAAIAIGSSDPGTL